MLIGPRMHDGKEGYLVVTPLERGGGPGTAVLVNRGWIAKKYKDRKARKAAGALPMGTVTVEGLLREPWKRNLFTPENSPETGEFYFPDVEQMARLAGTQAVWIEETMGTSLNEMIVSISARLLIRSCRAGSISVVGSRSQRRPHRPTRRGQPQE